MQLLIKKRAGKLYSSKGTNEEEFVKILATRSYAHLRCVFEEYKTVAGKDLSESVSSEFSGDIKNGLKTIVACIKNRQEYFANTLYKAMKVSSIYGICLKLSLNLNYSSKKF